MLENSPDLNETPPLLYGYPEELTKKKELSIILHNSLKTTTKTVLTRLTKPPCQSLEDLLQKLQVLFGKIPE